MLRDGKQLDMGEAKINDIRDEAGREFVVGKEPRALAAPPRAEMNLIDRHRLASWIAAPAPFKEIRVGPGETSGIAQRSRRSRAAVQPKSRPDRLSAAKDGRHLR